MPSHLNMVMSIVLIFTVFLSSRQLPRTNDISIHRNIFITLLMHRYMLDYGFTSTSETHQEKKKKDVEWRKVIGTILFEHQNPFFPPLNLKHSWIHCRCFDVASTMEKETEEKKRGDFFFRFCGVVPKRFFFFLYYMNVQCCVCLFFYMPV